MKLVIFSRRWWRNDTYDVELTATGWNIHSGPTGGNCAPTGAPYLFEILKTDNVNYPANLGGYMDWLWVQARERNMGEEKIQEHLDMLGRWISETERTSPTGIWLGYA